MKTRNKHRGSSFDDFLKEENIYEEVCAGAAKRTLAEQLKRALEKEDVKIAVLARRMNTSRAVVQRLLDKGNTSVTLQTLEKAARAIGMRWKFELVEA